MYTRFPEWYFCPRCRRFQPLKKWIAEYQRKTKGKAPEFDEYMVSHMQCPDCRQDLVVARIVTVCESGHLNDFPWIKWVHAKSKKPVCANSSLKFKTGASGSEGLEGLSIECSCGAQATLKNAFDRDVFEKMDEDNGTHDFLCEGNHPFNHTNESCPIYPKTVQRGASSVYFPVTHSSLVIPPYADKLNTRINQSRAYEECMIMIADEDSDEERKALIKKKLSKWSEKIALEIGESQSDVEKILKDNWLCDSSDSVDVTGVKYRFEEYRALTGEISAPLGSVGDFSREPMPIEEYGIPAEDARYVLPNACETTIFVTMDFRNFFHFLNERLCTRAQKEIRDIAKEMAKLAVEACPIIKPYCVPKCESFSIAYCPEHKSCGRHKPLKEIVRDEYK